MRILIAHNSYQQHGGEDVVFENEARHLELAGHNVCKLVVSNDLIKSTSDKIRATLGTVENSIGMKAVDENIRQFCPDVMHVHNFFPLLSPAIYQISRNAGVAVVQTLHNFRPICASGDLLRNGKVCLSCVPGKSIWGVVHRCYRDSFVASAAVARMIAVHRRQGTWLCRVDRYIALTQFARDVFVKGGFPSNRIEVKPNFIDDPGPPLDAIVRNGVLFVGRLSIEKGVSTLIDAARCFGFPLRIAGIGPDMLELQKYATSNVVFLGQISREMVLDEMRRAVAVVLPSVWYEGFPMVILEAFACATPVIASDLGGPSEIIQDGRTGCLTPPGDSAALGECIKRVLENVDFARQLGMAARKLFTERYTPHTNIMQLEGIYLRAVEELKQ